MELKFRNQYSDFTLECILEEETIKMVLHTHEKKLKNVLTYDDFSHDMKLVFPRLQDIFHALEHKITTITKLDN